VHKKLFSELLRALEGTLSRCSRLYLQSLAPTYAHWTRVVGYGLFSLCVIHKEGLCPSNEGINMLMMVVNIKIFWTKLRHILVLSNCSRRIYSCIWFGILIKSWSKLITYYSDKRILEGNSRVLVLQLIHNRGYNYANEFTDWFSVVIEYHLRKRSWVRSPYSTNICVHEHICL
jgi:hypothetical protein